MPLIAVKKFNLVQQRPLQRFGAVANADLAHRHLEQIVSAVLLASVEDEAAQPASANTAWREAMAEMSAMAYDAYQALVMQTPELIEYWRWATPLDEISRLHIGSRPASRRAGQLQVTHIRAIPWVFSWMQSRFNLPGWYGLGSALAALVARGRLRLLRDMYERWPFFGALLDNAQMSLLKADMGIASLYSTLAPDQELAGRVFARIEAEFTRSREMVLLVSGYTQLMQNEPVVQRSIHLRNPYVDPLNMIQVEMLRRLRALDDAQNAEAEALREVIVLTINGIAAGLRNTG